MDVALVCIFLGLVGVLAVGVFALPVPPNPEVPEKPRTVVVPPDTATLRRIRMAARAMGCNSAQRQMTEAYAAGLMARGESLAEAEEMARVFAGDLLHIDAERRSILR